MKKIIVEVVNTPVGFTKPQIETPIFACMPPDIAMAMFDEMMEMQELIDRGERCAKCGELHLPEDMSQGLCTDCLFDIIIEEMERDFEKEVEEILERYIMEQFYEMMVR